MKTLCLLVFRFVLVVPSFGEETYSDGNHLQTFVRKQIHSEQATA
ncbi:MAG: hypothetical protein NVS9B5_37080 [Terriglobales bacterium]